MLLFGGETDMAIRDYEGTRNADILPKVHAGRYDLFARFRDQGSAARAVADLRTLGFADEDVTILGNMGDIVNTSTGLSRADARVTGSSFRLAMAGAGIGAVLGAVLGIIVLALPPVQSALGTPVHAGGFIAAAIFGAIIGMTLGALVCGILGLDRSRAGEHTYDMQTGGGDTLVGVCAMETLRQNTASELLRQAGALSVERHAVPAG
jgi:hypothetical protein